MRRPRAGLVSRPSCDAGLCPGALTTPRQELADAEPPRFTTEAGRSGETKARAWYRKEERRQWSAERRPRCPKGSADYARLVRLEALHSPRIVEGRNLPPRKGDGRRPARGLE